MVGREWSLGWLGRRSWSRFSVQFRRDCRRFRHRELAWGNLEGVYPTVSAVGAGDEVGLTGRRVEELY